MCQWTGRRNFPAHAVAGFKQGPVEGFAIECDQHPALGEPPRQREQQRALLAVIAHEELFDLESATLPPRDADEKCVGAAPPRKSRGFRVKKYPLLGIRNMSDASGTSSSKARKSPVNRAGSPNLPECINKDGLDS
jgi:hypothetical protein